MRVTVANAEFAVHVTRDGGTTWTNVTPSGLPPFTRISLIDASPHDAGTAYLAGNRYQRSDRAPYVYKTSDFGKSWTKIVNGVRPDDFPRAIREDPKRRGLLFLGTETAFYVSFDEGAVVVDEQLEEMVLRVDEPASRVERARLACPQGVLSQGP